MLSRICRYILREEKHGNSDVFNFNLFDYRGLRAYPKSTPRKQRQVNRETQKNVHCSKGDCISTEGDCV